MKYCCLLLVLSFTSTSAQTQLQMNQEAANSMRLADAQMTSIYKQAMNSGDAQQKRLLLLAQRQWIKYKEAHCKAVANDYDKGSMQAMIFCNCITELTKERTQKIKRYLQEGGLYSSFNLQSINCMYDLIGDIHGHCATLQKLLTQLGYRDHNGIWQHHTRKIIFVGDYIDRGPQVRETLQLVKGMSDAGHAIALMGNHEYNAVAYATPNGKGDYLRSHSAMHTKQHSATLQQFVNYPHEWQAYLQWFRTLPLFLDLGDIRAVHACWDETDINWLKEKNYYTLTDKLLDKAHQRSTKEHVIIEEILKGKELNIPEEFVRYDKDGHARTANRIKWWIEKCGAHYGDFLFSCPPEMTDEPVPDHLDINIYPATAPPVFIGHYWLDELEPALQSSNVICLDYSVAKEGYLVAYRWNGEQQANPANFVVQHK